MTHRKSSAPTLSYGICAFIILTLLILGCGRFGGQNRSGIGDIDLASLPTLGPDEPFPTMSGQTLDALITDNPELSKHRDKILEAERAAINGLLADARARSLAANAASGGFELHLAGTSKFRVKESASAHPSIPTATKLVNTETPGWFNASVNLIPAVHAADAPAVPEMGGLQYYLIGSQITFITDDLGSIRDSDRNTKKVVPMKDESTGEVQANMTRSIDEKGNPGNELSTSINMPQFGLNANSRVKLIGNRCPGADGKLDVTIEYGTNGRAGSSSSVIYDKNLKARVMANVNDSAEVSNVDVELKQATRSTTGGRQVYLETSVSGQATNGSFSDLKFGDLKLDRASSQANSDDAGLSEKGLQDALRLAIGVLTRAELNWKDGGCVKIDAPSPGSVQPNSTTQIPVKVLHKIDGSEVPSKLDVALTGGASIDPTMIAKTAGTLSYVAPGERGKTATIKLESTSRRGKAKLDLTASTGGNAFRVSAESNMVSFSGEICSLDKPFTLDATFPGGTSVMTFNPGGAMSSTGGGSGCTQTGSGNFTITMNPDGSGMLDWSSSDTVKCPMGFSNSRANKFSVPLKPAPELTCN